MKNLKIKMAGLVVAIAFGLFPVLILLGNYEKERDENNGFKRNVISDKLSVSRVTDLQFQGYYFSGEAGDTIFLGHTAAPAHILVHSTLSGETNKEVYNIPVEKFDYTESSRIKVVVKPPFIFFLNGMSSTALITSRTKKRDTLNQIFFNNAYDQFAITNKRNLILRAFNFNQTGMFLSLVDVTGVELKNHDLTQQENNFFASDGILNASPQYVVYQYLYNNKFLVFDQKLNLVSIGRTLDTITTPQIKLHLNENENSMTFAEPPLVVNKSAVIGDSLLYVLSALKADNEEKYSFRRNQVVDIYDLATGAYRNSFYIPYYKKLAPNDVYVLDNQLLVLYERFLVNYSF